MQLEKRKRKPKLLDSPESSPNRDAVKKSRPPTTSATTQSSTPTGSAANRNCPARTPTSAAHQSRLQDPKIVVGIDFGTTCSGFAYTLQEDPKDVVTFCEWPFKGTAEATRNCKTQTSLWYLPGRDGTFNLQAWGWEAQVKHSEVLQARKFRKTGPKLLPCTSSQQTGPDVRTHGHYLTKFKLHLAPKGSYSCGSQAIVEELPEGLLLEKVISDYLRQLSIVVMEELRNRLGSSIHKKDIKWCLSVPTIWTNTGKQDMKDYAEMAGLVLGRLCPDKDASPHEIDIVLEPEAAAIYCQQKLKTVSLTKGSRFIVVDAGGGTIDLVAHEKLTDHGLAVKEVTCSTREICGGTFLDVAFWKYLGRRIDGFQNFSAQYPAIILNLKREWEVMKTNFDGERDEYYLDLPATLADAWEANQTAKGSWSATSQYDHLLITGEDMRRIFDGEVKKILKLIREQLNQVPESVAVMVVGGLANSRYVMKKIRDSFSRKGLEIICPPDPGSAVCQGAVMWGSLGDDTIRSRKSRRTYGIDTVGPFKEGDPARFAFINVNGEKLCLNKFCVFTRIGDDVPVNHPVTYSFGPFQKGEKEIKFRMFSTSDPQPRLVTDPGVVRVAIGRYALPPETWTMKAEPSLAVTMYFGRTTIEVSAKPKNFDGGKKPMFSVNFERDIQ